MFQGSYVANITVEAPRREVPETDFVPLGPRSIRCELAVERRRSVREFLEIGV